MRGKRSTVPPSSSSSSSSSNVSPTKSRKRGRHDQGQRTSTSSSTSPKEHGASANVPAFLRKTFELVNNSKYQCVIWNDEGDALLVKDLNAFQYEVLPRYFKHSNFQSFVRQLNMYNFHKTKHDSSWREFKHPYFKRGRPDLLPFIRRKTNQNAPLTVIPPGIQDIEPLDHNTATTDISDCESASASVLIPKAEDGNNVDERWMADYASEWKYRKAGNTGSYSFGSHVTNTTSQQNSDERRNDTWYSSNKHPQRTGTEVEANGLSGIRSNSMEDETAQVDKIVRLERELQEMKRKQNAMENRLQELRTQVLGNRSEHEKNGYFDDHGKQLVRRTPSNALTGNKADFESADSWISYLRMKAKEENNFLDKHQFNESIRKTFTDPGSRPFPQTSQSHNSLVLHRNSSMGKAGEGSASTSPNLAALFTACDTMRAVDTIGRHPSFEDTATSPFELPGPADGSESLNSQKSTENHGLGIGSVPDHSGTVATTEGADSPVIEQSTTSF